MQARGSIDIARPPTAVFEYMDIPENQARISPRLSAVETIGTFDNGAKRATYTYQLFGLAFSGEVRGIEHDPPEKITFEMTGAIEGRIQWGFEETDVGTQVTYAAEYDLGVPAGISWLAGPIIDRFNQREIERTLDNLRAGLEPEPRF